MVWFMKKRKQIAAGLFTAAAVLLCACGAEMKETEDDEMMVREYRDLKYDTMSESQTLDLFLPKTGEGPYPLVFFIHGGGWYSGDKTDGQEAPWMKLLDRGYAVASVNYRLSGEASHPAGITDCKTALRYLKAHAGEYGIDPDRVASAGDSSGGHYALMMAVTMERPEFEDLSRGYTEFINSLAADQCGSDRHVLGNLVKLLSLFIDNFVKSKMLKALHKFRICVFIIFHVECLLAEL